jgi:CHAT domain-containing protein/tetratricopeptide (TPR) repeat protein
MDIEAFIQQVLNSEAPPLPDNLTLDTARSLADRLKAEAERTFRIDPNISLRCSEEIIRVGEAVNDAGILALGTMSRGDGLWMHHRGREAWEMYMQAGDLFQQIGDEIGWARTCIGRSMVCVEMNRVEDTLNDAKAARAIFLKHQQYEKLIRLETNVATVLNYLAEYQATIEQCQMVMQLMESTQQVDDTKLIVIYSIMGGAYQALGNLRDSLAAYEQERALMVANGETFGIMQVDLSIINVAQAQGNNRKALQLIHRTIDQIQRQFSHDSGREMMHLVQGYLFLNRFNDARNLAHEAVEHRGDRPDSDDLAVLLLQAAIAEAALGNFDQAFQDLERAERVYISLNATAWLGTVYLYRAQVALRQGDYAVVRKAARAAAEHARQNKQQVAYLTSLLLFIRVETVDEHFENARLLAYDVQKLARQLHIPHLRYEAHFLLGKTAEHMGLPKRALRHYQAATAIMERIQRSLVLTSRADFMTDKQDSITALVRLNLELGHVEDAFAALERAKAQVWLSYLGQLDHLRWLRDDPESQSLIEELIHLREEHHWFYNICHDPVFRENQHIPMSTEEAAAEASVRERRLSALTEQLYLHSSAEDLSATASVSVTTIQEHLHSGTAMIAYYTDGCNWWGFFLHDQTLEVRQLAQPNSSIENLVDKWQANVNRALRTMPGSTDAKMLTNYAVPLMQRLYNALLLPFAEHLGSIERLIIVPYGALHYLPFQLLHDGDQYLIEKTEIAILPTASLITRKSPQQQRRVLALAYNWDGRLHYTGEEANRVVGRFGGQALCEDQAVETALSVPPGQILHISAHGQYRIDQPEFSYIQLADGPLYTDDLFQHDLPYELITLSACETARSRAAAGDELIGLGRGFLFAGAGALIASLWRVEETFTSKFMDEFYQQLDCGASKAAALRLAQLSLMRTYPGLHPAFWGAFELIGNADPLSQFT